MRRELHHGGGAGVKFRGRWRRTRENILLPFAIGVNCIIKMNGEDLTLLQAYARENSEQAFAALVSRYVNLVFSVARRQVGDPHQAEDITQAVFIILARKAASLGPKTILPGWLCRTARYVSANALTTQRRRRQREEEAQMQSMTNSSEDEAWRQIAPLLDDAMDQLGQKDHDAVVLRFFEGRDFHELGAALGASEDAAKMRVSRALEKLRKFFMKRGVRSTGAVIAAVMAAHSVQAAPPALAISVTAAAVAKGAAVSGSTLTLIHGALKLMALTKAKTMALAGVAILLTASTSVVVVEAVHSARVAAYPDIEGAWEGLVHLEEPGAASGETASTRMVLRLTKTNDNYSATVDWIDKGRTGYRFDKVDYDFPSLRLERLPKQVWNLTLKPDATEMIWDYHIRFVVSDPVALRRTTTPDPVPARLTEAEFTPRPGSALQGYWKGVIGSGPDVQPVKWKISEATDGTFRAEADNPMHGANGLPSSVIFNRPTVKFVLASGAGIFQGDINNENTEITGSWTQDGQSLPASVKRADYQSEHAQDADKDYAFASRNDLQGHWKGSWDFMNVPVPEALDIAKLPDGTFSATYTDLENMTDYDPVPASDIQYDAPRLRLNWKWAQVGFEGSLENGKLKGTWLQVGGGFALVLERSGSK
jgi:RNA polymerase sigma factor (sigma-70 family)